MSKLTRDMSLSHSSLPKCFMPGCQDVDLFATHVSLNEIACVASVSVGFGSKERPRNGVFRYFACAENGARAKKRTVGVGEGKEGTACGQTPGF